jgi:uncharacterized OB-fold protein
MGLIEFTRNYDDLSTERGFQFEFYCDRCGNGYRTRFEPLATGTISEALDAASGILGGLFGRAAEVADTVHSVAWEKAHDAAFTRAVEEARPHFHKCRRCGQWVDDDCWNVRQGLCKDCAPVLEEELAAVQAEAAVADAQEKAEAIEYVDAARLKETITVTCPHCGAAVPGGKFCAECGKPLRSEKHCPNCGAKVPATAKFCPECGAKQ